MKTDRLDSVNAISHACGVSWATAKKWTGRKGFPPHAKNGWETGAVLAFAKDAKHAAGKAQSGPHRELKAEKLKREIKRLDELIGIDRARRRRAERAAEVATTGLVSRGDAVKAVSQIGLAIHAALKVIVAENIKGMSSYDPEHCKQHGELRNALAFVSGCIKTQIERALAEPPLSLSAEEIKAATLYMGMIPS